MFYTIYILLPVVLLAVPLILMFFTLKGLKDYDLWNKLCERTNGVVRVIMGAILFVFYFWVICCLIGIDF
jgi:hypothetical protein